MSLILNDGKYFFRFPVSHGIAGHVARTGEVVLCDNVANDNRFNSQVDLRTGYKTKTILCGPLKTGETYDKRQHIIVT